MRIIGTGLAQRGIAVAESVAPSNMRRAIRMGFLQQACPIIRSRLDALSMGVPSVLAPSRLRLLEFGEHRSELLDQRQQLQLRHRGAQLIEHAAPPIPRVGATLGGI